MPNTQNDRYALQQKLNEGAADEVWLATDTAKNRPVVIKQLPVPADFDQLDAALAAAKKLVNLSHPNIAEVYDAGFDETTQNIYLVGEYVDGKTLADYRFKERPSSLITVLDVTMGILHALQYLHGRDILHRDLKPSNVLVGKNEIKVTDTGLVELRQLLAQTDQNLITNPHYISPEQAEGRATDNRSDLYSLGVMLFEMVSGTLPFDYKDVPTLLRAHAYAPPPSIRTLVPDIPLVLERTIMRLLSKSQRSRYASADVVISVLGSIHAQQKIKRPKITAPAPQNNVLIGRHNELTQMESLWTDIQQTSRPRLLVIQGELGVGKTRLIIEFTGNRATQEDAVVLKGRCEEFGTSYAPFAEILTAVFNLNLVIPDTVVNQTAPIVSQIPQLNQILDDVSKPTTNDAPANDPKLAQWQFFEAVLTVLTELGPTVLFLEDANLLDETSVALARFLVRHGQIPLLLIAACSNDKDAVPWLDEFAANEKEVLSLRSLRTAAVGDYLTNLLGGPVSESLVTMVYKHSQGNPSFVEEIIRHLLDSGQCKKNRTGKWEYAPRTDTHDLALPSNLFNLYTQRVQELSEQSQNTLAVAAVIGYEFEYDTWLTLLGGESERAQALDALDEALDKRLLREAGNGRYIFHPADIANVLISLLSTSQQHRLHLQVVEYLLTKPNIDPASIAHHYEQAGLAAEAAQYLEAAGAKAITENAINKAIAYYTRANTLVESQATYEALGNLYRQRGEADESIRSFNKALRLARLAEDYNSEARILNGLAFVLWLYDSYQEADEAAASVLKLPNVSDTERAIAQSHLGMILWLRGQLMDAEYWCQKAVELLEDTDGNDASLAGAYSRLGLVYFARSQYGDAKVMFNQSLKIRQRLEDYWGQAYGLNNLGKVATDQGDFDQASSLLLSAEYIFDSIDSKDGLMVVFANRARVLLRQGGQADEAIPLIEKALTLANQIGKQSAYGLGDIYLLMAQAQIQQQELEQARVSTDKAMHLVEVAGNQEYMAKALALQAQIYTAQGNSEQAEETFKQAISLFKRVGNPAGLLRTRLRHAQFLTVQGQTNGADLEQEARMEAARIGLHL